MSYYVVVIEHKIEEPMVLETLLRHSTYEEAERRVERFRQDPNIIRISICKLEHVFGNKSILKETEKEE